MVRWPGRGTVAVADPSQNVERMRPGRRREGSVEGKKVVGGQLDISGGCVFSNVGRCSGAWDSVDAVVLKDPRQRKLCRRGVVMPRNRVQRRVCEQPALLDRRVGHGRDAMLGQPRQQRVLRASAGQVVQNLIRLDRVTAWDADNSIMSSTSRLLTPQWRIIPASFKSAKPSIVSANGMRPRQCRR